MALVKPINWSSREIVKRNVKNICSFDEDKDVMEIEKKLAHFFLYLIAQKIAKKKFLSCFAGFEIHLLKKSHFMTNEREERRRNDWKNVVHVDEMKPFLHFNHIQQEFVFVPPNLMMISSITEGSDNFVVSLTKIWV